MRKEIMLGKKLFIIEDKDDEIRLAHILAQNNFTPSEIALIMGISKKKVQEYLEDCW